MSMTFVKICCPGLYAFVFQILNHQNWKEIIRKDDSTWPGKSGQKKKTSTCFHAIYQDNNGWTRVRPSSIRHPPHHPTISVPKLASWHTPFCQLTYLHLSVVQLFFITEVGILLVSLSLARWFTWTWCALWSFLCHQSLLEKKKCLLHEIQIRLQQFKQLKQCTPVTSLRYLGE